MKAFKAYKKENKISLRATAFVYDDQAEDAIDGARACNYDPFSSAFLLVNVSLVFARDCLLSRNS